MLKNTFQISTVTFNADDPETPCSMYGDAVDVEIRAYEGGIVVKIDHLLFGLDMIEEVMREAIKLKAAAAAYAKEQQNFTTTKNRVKPFVNK